MSIQGGGGECIVVLCHMQQYFSYIYDGTYMCRRTEEEVVQVYGQAPNAIDI